MESIPHAEDPMLSVCAVSEQTGCAERSARAVSEETGRAERSARAVSEETGRVKRSEDGAFRGARKRGSVHSSEILGRTGRRRERKNAGNVIWSVAVFGMVICLLAELGTAVGIPVMPVLESGAERILTAIPQESIGQFQNVLYSLILDWTTDSLPVCSYFAAAASSTGDGTSEEEGDTLSPGYAAVLWSAVAGEPFLRTALAAGLAAGDGETYSSRGEGELSAKSEAGDGEEGSGGEAEEGTEEDEGESGDGAGESETDPGMSEGEEKQENNAGSAETGTDAFPVPAVTGKLYTAETLTYSFLASNFYNISSSTVVYESELNGSLLSVPLTLPEITEEPQILIYHTHSHEFFADSDTSDLNTGIVGVGSYLAELLEGYGYSVIHLTDQFDYVDGELDRSKAYTYAATRLKEVLAENPSIEVMIDLHRDGVDDGLHLVTEINGKSTAMIMFFNGMSRTASGNISYLPNTNLQANLAFSLQLKVKAEAYYPGFTRKNYIKPYRYNLHLLGKALLIEAGAQTNTFEEVKNAMEPLAVLLHIQLSGAE